MKRDSKDNACRYDPPSTTAEYTMSGIDGHTIGWHFHLHPEEQVDISHKFPLYILWAVVLWREALQSVWEVGG